MPNSVKAGTAASVLALLGYNESNMGELASIVADAAIALKAMPRSEDDHAETIEDRWHKGKMHAVPTKEEILTGPSQSSSGGGAEHMISQYSNVAPQKGLVLEAERLEQHLAPLHAATKAIQDGHNGLCRTFDHSMGEVGKSLASLHEQNQRLTIVSAALLKAIEKNEDEKGDDDDEKEEKFEINASKAAECYAKARALLKKSRSIKAAVKAGSDASHITALKSQAKLFKNAAKAYFSKAAQLAAAGKSRAVVTRKALDDFFAANPALKAEFDPAIDAKSLAKAAKKARADWKALTAKAEGHDEGNQADSEKEENGNQEDHAKAQTDAATVEMKAKVEDALKGIGMLQGNIQTLFDAISGKAVTPAVAPANPAVTPVAKGSMINRVDALVEQYSGESRIDPTGAHKARDLAMKLDAVNQGMLPKATWDAMLAGSPQVVQEIFKVAA